MSATALRTVERADLEQAKSTASLVRIIGETLPLTKNGKKLWLGVCPFHDESTPSFTVYENPGHYHCFGCGAHGDVVDWLMKSRKMTFQNAIAHIGATPDAGRTQAPPRPAQPREASPTSMVWRRCWDEGVTPFGTIVETYLDRRGKLHVPDGADIRFHPRCQRGKRDMPGGPAFAPAMLALMTQAVTGEPVGVHRTFLLPDGSAKAPTITRGDTTLKSRSVLGTWGVIRLVPDSEISKALGIGEGIENALTAMQTIGWGPVWAAGTQNALANFPILPFIESLSIFADADDAGVGIQAALTCADRWHKAGREVQIHTPPAGHDWNSVFSNGPK